MRDPAICASDAPARFWLIALCTAAPSLMDFEPEEEEEELVPVCAWVITMQDRRNDRIKLIFFILYKVFK
jgi:hypothetical protein